MNCVNQVQNINEYQSGLKKTNDFSTEQQKIYTNTNDKEPIFKNYYVQTCTYRTYKKKSNRRSHKKKRKYAYKLVLKIQNGGNDIKNRHT